MYYSNQNVTVTCTTKIIRDDDFVTVPTSAMTDYYEEYKPDNRFFQDITNSNLIDFASCLQSTTN
jgi:hypothetical protein